MTPEQRRLRAQIAAHEMWANCDDPAAQTAPARRAFLDGSSVKWTRKIPCSPTSALTEASMPGRLTSSVSRSSPHRPVLLKQPDAALPSRTAVGVVRHSSGRSQPRDQRLSPGTVLERPWRRE
jgi:hypothetical protein